MPCMHDTATSPGPVRSSTVPALHDVSAIAHPEHQPGEQEHHHVVRVIDGGCRPSTSRSAGGRDAGGTPAHGESSQPGSLSALTTCLHHRIAVLRVRPLLRARPAAWHTQRRVFVASAYPSVMFRMARPRDDGDPGGEPGRCLLQVSASGRSLTGDRSSTTMIRSTSS